MTFLDLLTSVASNSSSLDSTSSQGGSIAGNVSSVQEWFSLFWQSLSSFFVTGSITENTVATSLLGRLLIAVVIVVPLYLIIKIIIKLMSRPSKKANATQSTYRSFLLSFVKLISYTILILILLSLLGFNLSGLSTIISSAVVAIGLSLQDVISNFASGIIVISSKKFLKGDYISLNNGEAEGTVLDIRILDTKLLTVENVEITVPNSKFVNGKVANFNVMQYRRIDLTVSVTYGSNVDDVKDILLYMVNKQDGVNKDMAITVFVKEFSSSSIDLGVRCYVPTSIFWNVKWALNESIYKELVARKVDIPYNQLDVHVFDKPYKAAKADKNGITPDLLKVPQNPISNVISRNDLPDDAIDSLLDNFEKSSKKALNDIKKRSRTTKK